MSSEATRAKHRRYNVTQKGRERRRRWRLTTRVYLARRTKDLLAQRARVVEELQRLEEEGQ